MKDLKEYINDQLLIRTIEAHKRIINEGEFLNLNEIGYEEGTSYERVKSYNTFTILTKLNFNYDEATNPKSKSAIKLDEIVATNSDVGTIISKLIEYREKLTE
jgi:hypothetical protein